MLSHEFSCFCSSDSFPCSAGRAGGLRHHRANGSVVLLHHSCVSVLPLFFLIWFWGFPKHFRSSWGSKKDQHLCQFLGDIFNLILQLCYFQMKGHEKSCNFWWFYSFCSVMTMDSKTCRRQQERHERVTEQFVQDMLSALSLFLWPDINKRMEIEKTSESTWKSSYTRTVKTKIKYSTTIFFRKGKCLGSSCWDHPASLHKWGPWHHRETRMFQLHSFVR